MHGSAHAQRCEACGEATQQTDLIHRLLRQRADQINRQKFAPSPYFMAKLTARLRTEAEPYLLTWEHAVPALRGWMLTFSAAAALLLMTAAFTLSANPAQPEEHVFTASTNESQQHDAFWLED